MALSDILSAQLPDVRKGPACTVCDALASLCPADAETLRDLLRSPTVRYTTLSDALRADEDTPLDIPPETLSRHARGRCAARERLR